MSFFTRLAALPEREQKLVLLAIERNPNLFASLESMTPDVRHAVINALDPTIFRAAELAFPDRPSREHSRDIQTIVSASAIPKHVPKASANASAIAVATPKHVPKPKLNRGGRKRLVPCHFCGTRRHNIIEGEPWCNFIAPLLKVHPLARQRLGWTGTIDIQLAISSKNYRDKLQAFLSDKTIQQKIINLVKCLEPMEKTQDMEETEKTEKMDETEHTQDVASALVKLSQV